MSKVKYRPHRALLADAMALVVEVESLEELRNHILEADGEWIDPKGTLKVERYGTGVDERNGWKTHIVLWNGTPTGFTSDTLH